MPDDFSERIRYFITQRGRQRSRAELRERIDTLTNYVKKQSKVYATQFVEKSITRIEFEALMQELLKSSHIIASTVGRGGIERMVESDWLRVAKKIAWQEKYLRRFARMIAADQLSGPASSNRVQLYADALNVSYYRSVYADQSDRPTDVPRDSKGNELLVQLVQNSAEGCPECNEDAAMGFVPLDTMGEIGSRNCQDFCKCDLVFSDD